MSDQLKMRCSCGAEFSMDVNTYLQTGGTLDGKGRRYLAEKRADDWNDAHAKCLSRPAPRADSGGEG